MSTENNSEKKKAIKKPAFTPYQKFVIFILAFIQFTVVLDFVIISPLSDKLLKVLSISTQKFGWLVSAYAFSAGIFGFISSGFSDRFDRKKMLTFFYTGFVLGTLFCALATDYYTLLAARITTGIFGGVIASVSFAIITDLFPFEQRGRVMGFVQMAFAVSQVLGVPAGLYFSGLFNWHAPFYMIVLIAIPAGILMFIKLKPVAGHLSLQRDHSAFIHLYKTLKNKNYMVGFISTIILATGGYMMMPFSSAFLVYNVQIKSEDLAIIFGVTGIFSMITGPLTGILADKLGKYPMFFYGSLVAMAMAVIYTNLPPVSIWVVITINCVMFAGISSRMISSSALVSALPSAADRGAFMGLNSSIQQLSGGLAAALAGSIVSQSTPESPVYNYDILGYIVVVTMVIMLFLMYKIYKITLNLTHDKSI